MLSHRFAASINQRRRDAGFGQMFNKVNAMLAAEDGQSERTASVIYAINGGLRGGDSLAKLI
jgi:hypothetical protein